LKFSDLQKRNEYHYEREEVEVKRHPEPFERAVDYVENSDAVHALPILGIK